jgi:hypothetical protein
MSQLTARQISPKVIVSVVYQSSRVAPAGYPLPAKQPTRTEAVQHGGCTAGRSASGRGFGPLRADERECGSVNGLVGGVKKSGRCRHPGPVVRSVESGEVAGETQQRNGVPESLIPRR